MKSSKKYLIVGVFVVLCAALVFGGLFWNSNRGYTTVKPHKGPVVEAVYGVGTVTARKIYQIKTSVPGIIKQIFVKEGQGVSQGDPLLVLDEGAKFKAPFDGTVTSVPFKVGELVSPQVPVLTLMNLKDLFLEVSLEQQSALRIKAGQSAVATFETLRNERFVGKVDAVFPREGQFIVRIELEKMPESVLPAMTSDVSIEVSQRENALLVPVAGISSGRVLLIRNGKRVKTNLQIGAVDGEWAEVISGDIKLDDEILVKTK